MSRERTSNIYKMRKSHTCGSLFAKCNCSMLSISSQIPTFATVSTSVVRENIKNSSSSNTNTSISSNEILPNKLVDNKKTRRLFQSFSHPDTDFIFTEESIRPQNQTLMSDNSTIISKEYKNTVKHPTRSSSPNINQFTVVNVEVHPELFINIKENRISIPNHSSEKNIDDLKSEEPSDFDLTEAAQKYFEESGILGPITSPNVIRKSSKILQNPKAIDKVNNSDLLIIHITFLL